MIIRIIEPFYKLIFFVNRLENEHLNNVGHYRAVKTVPLPFRDADSDNWGVCLIHVNIVL